MSSQTLNQLQEKYHLPESFDVEPILQFLANQKISISSNKNKLKQQSDRNLDFLTKIANICENGYIAVFPDLIKRIESEAEFKCVSSVIDLMIRHYQYVDAYYKLQAREKKYIAEKVQMEQRSKNNEYAQNVRNTQKQLHQLKAQNTKMIQQQNTTKSQIYKLIEQNIKLSNENTSLQKQKMEISSLEAQVKKLRKQNQELIQQNKNNEVNQILRQQFVVKQMKKQKMVVDEEVSKLREENKKLKELTITSINTNEQITKLKNQNKIMQQQIINLKKLATMVQNYPNPQSSKVSDEQLKNDHQVTKYIMPKDQKLIQLSAESRQIFFIFHLFLGYEIGSFDKPIISFLPERNYLIDSIEQYCRKNIKRTKLVFAYDSKVALNPHVYVDEVANYVIVFRLTNDHIIATYSQERLSESVGNDGPGLLINLTKRIKLSVERTKAGIRTTEYNKYHIIFGNDELKFQINKKQITSFLGNRYGYYMPKMKPEQFFQMEEESIYFGCYEVFKVIFEGEK